MGYDRKDDRLEEADQGEYVIPSNFTEGKRREAAQTMERYNRFMALKAKKNPIIDMIEHLDLATGVSFRGYHGSFGKRVPNCSKGHLAECYATGMYFKPGSLAKLEKELGTTWSKPGKGGLW